MIRRVRVTAGYPTKLAALGERTFEFAEGLTVLFGQNASGKSTLLRIMAAYSGCARPGWTTFSEEYNPRRQFRWPPEYKPPFPERFADGTLGDVRADVDWDGTPTYFWKGLPGGNQGAFDEALERGGGEADDYMRRMLGTGSSGQPQIHWINERLEQALDRPPVIARDATFFVPGKGYVTAKRRSNWASDLQSEWATGIDEFVEFVESRPRTGPVTVLLDEPDARLSLPNQEKLWRVFLPRLSVGRQIVVASHSPFALLGPSIVDLDPGYSGRCREALGALTGGS